MRTDDSSWTEPSEVHVTRIDVPFLDLTWFFVKASLAMALAFSVTSWLWVVIGTGVLTLSAGLLVLVGVPGWFVSPPGPTVAAPTPPAVVTVLPSPPPAPSVIQPAPAPEPEPEVAPDEPTDAEIDANRAATEAMMRAEIERHRREKQQQR